MMFQNEYRFLSNFICPNPIVFDGVKYSTVEHAYVAHKTTDKQLRLGISKIKSPGEAKKYGRTINIRKDFDFLKLHLMFKLVKLKFKNNPYLLEKLISIDGEIVEHNYWHDNFWGNCTCQKCNDIMGENNLGKILMYIRENGVN